MKTIKELIDFARANPGFFTQRFGEQIFNESMNFGQNYTLMCESGEIISNKEDTTYTKEEIEGGIFRAFRLQLIKSMTEKIEESCLGSLRLIYNDIKAKKSGCEANFKVEEEVFLTTIKDNPVALNLKNNKLDFQPCEPHQKLSGLINFSRSLQAEQTEREALEKRIQKHAELKLKKPSPIIIQKKPSQKRGPYSPELRISILRQEQEKAMPIAEQLARHQRTLETSTV